MPHVPDFERVDRQLASIRDQALALEADFSDELARVSERRVDLEVLP